MKRVLWIVITAMVVLAGALVLILSNKTTVVVGVLGDFTEADTSFADFGYHGVELAMVEINDAQKDVKYQLQKIDVSEYDTIDKLEKRVQELRLSMIIGPFLSGNLVTYADYLMLLDIPVFIPSATHDVITGNEDSVFRLMNATSIQGNQTAVLLQDLEYENIVLLYDSFNQMYTKEMVDYIKDDDVLDGATITLYEMANSEEDFSVVITDSVDVIFICGAGEKTAKTINNLREEGYTQKIFISSYSDSSVFLETIGYNVDDVYLYTNRNIQYEQAYNQFVSRYLERVGSQPSIPSMMSYESLYMYHNYFYPGSISTEELITDLNELEMYNGFFFNYISNENGDFYTNMGLYEVTAQTFHKIVKNDID